MRKNMKYFFGNIIRGISWLIGGLFTVLLLLVDSVLWLIQTVFAGFAAIIGAAGCFAALLIPIIVSYYLNMGVLSLMILVILIAGILYVTGIIARSALVYWQYTTTEYLNSYSDYLQGKAGAEYKSFSHYQAEYKRKQEEAYAREQAERARQEQEFWNERFRTWYEYQQQNRGYHYQYGGQTGSSTVYDPTAEFKDKYEKACRVLGVDTNADKYAIKLAYRKMAKQYHPDLNHEAGATEKFQEINEAFSFLSDENIERYKRIAHGA